MTTFTIRALLSVTVAVATLAAGLSARADDTELLVGPAVVPAVNQPNILFILDTSGSMSGAVRPAYNPSIDYPGTCRDDRIYWRLATGSPPNCSTDQWVPLAAFKCDAATANLNAKGRTVSSLRAAQWRSSSGVLIWRDLSTSNRNTTNYVECQEDQGVHGNGVDVTEVYAANNISGDTTIGPWNSTASSEIAWDSRRDYVFYTGNHVNYANVNISYWPTSQRSTRIEVMKSVLTEVLDDLTDVNVALMRYSNNAGEGSGDYRAQGGMVIHEMQSIETNRIPMQTSINGWVPSGMTPLSETLYEAHQYLSGSSVVWGNDSRISPAVAKPSVPASRTSDSNRYDSPMDVACQKTYIVFLTDGLPTADQSSNGDISSLVGEACEQSGDGACLINLSRYLFQSDLRSDVAGLQNVTSYWIGFDIASGAARLERTANEGGGEFFGAADTPELIEAITTIIEKIRFDSLSFTSPTVSVNAFNRTQNLNELYMSVFKPSTQYRWLGNIKKYRLRPDGTIIDADLVPAVDPSTGFFYTGARSYWSVGDDGANAAIGGAAGLMLSPGTRKIFSNLTSESGPLNEHLKELKASANLLMANTLVLGIPSTTAVTGRPAPADLVDWAYGYDVFDANDNGNLTEARADMGDPLHARPAAVIYGGPADNPDLTLYATTNDGMLHAIDAETGGELWAFMPRQLIGRLEQLSDDEDVTTRGYGLDSSVEVLRIDRNGNGEIEPEGTDIDGVNGVEDDEKDRVILFFGMRRGGSHYFALDVTERDAPQLLWRIGENDDWLATSDDEYLPGVGQTWSSPTVARVNVSGHAFTGNPDKFVLIFGGGYDTGQDKIAYQPDSVGNRVYMVDALSGKLLWRAGPTADTGAQLKLGKMVNAIPGEVRAVDLTGDGFVDRMYAGDLGGRVWRFDIRNGQVASSLVQGGVFASVGVGDSDPRPNASNRRFFYAPDIALIKRGSSNWINVAIGSGHREKPVTDQTAVNRFYSLRDYNMFTVIANNQYKDFCDAGETTPCHAIITDADPVDVTSDVNPSIPDYGPGWKLTLTLTGEKVLAESRTFQNQIYFTSFEPSVVSSDPASCSSRLGINRLYVVDAATGDPVENFDISVDGATDVSDRSRELVQRGTIAPEAIFVFPTPDPIPGNPNPPAVPPICLVGLESCGTGLLNPPVRTYWQQRGTN
jgi:type IV pilus assembly protein PilY1